MKTISFGRMYTVKDAQRITVKQREIEDVINNKFQNREDRNGSNGTYPRTLDEMLEEDMYVDIYVRHKKNGDVEISLKDSKPNDSLINGIVKKKDKISLTLNHKLPSVKIRKLVTEYANKCRSLADFYCGKIPNEAGKRIDDVRKKGMNPEDAFDMSMHEEA